MKSVLGAMGRKSEWTSRGRDATSIIPADKGMALRARLQGRMMKEESGDKGKRKKKKCQMRMDRAPIRVAALQFVFRD
jgi:hypothetical protein